MGSQRAGHDWATFPHTQALVYKFFGSTSVEYTEKPQNCIVNRLLAENKCWEGCQHLVKLSSSDTHPWEWCLCHVQITVLLEIVVHKRKVLSKQPIYLNSMPFPGSRLNQILSYKAFLDSVSKRQEFRPDPCSCRLSKLENFAKCCCTFETTSFCFVYTFSLGNRFSRALGMLLHFFGT